MIDIAIPAPKAPAPPPVKPAAAEGGKPDPGALVDEAKASGKLEGLQKVLDDRGYDCDAGTLLMLAQNDDRTAGKSPDELADMLEQDQSLYADLDATKPGGKLEKHADVETPAEDAVEGPGAEAEEDAVAGKMKTAMSERDKKRAPGVLKRMGESSATMDKDFDTKAKFMRKMAGEK
jgi:hypothetical protein